MKRNFLNNNNNNHFITRIIRKDVMAEFTRNTGFARKLTNLLLNRKKEKLLEKLKQFWYKTCYIRLWW